MKQLFQLTRRQLIVKTKPIAWKVLINNKIYVLKMEIFLIFSKNRYHYFRNLYKKWTKTGEVYEEALKSAINQVLDTTLSIRKSAQKFGIKPTTLQSPFTRMYKKAAVEKKGNSVTLVLMLHSVAYFRSNFMSNQVFNTEEGTIY